MSQPYASASPRGIKILEDIVDDWEKLSAIQRELLGEFARIAQKQRARFGDVSETFLETSGVLELYRVCNTKLEVCLLIIKKIKKTVS